MGTSVSTPSAEHAQETSPGAEHHSSADVVRDSVGPISGGVSGLAAGAAIGFALGGPPVSAVGALLGAVIVTAAAVRKRN